jgi:hypothetical protein
MIRRLKCDVLSQLPAKRRQAVFVETTATSRRAKGGSSGGGAGGRAAQKTAVARALADAGRKSNNNHNGGGDGDDDDSLFAEFRKSGEAKLKGVNACMSTRVCAVCSHSCVFVFCDAHLTAHDDCFDFFSISILQTSLTCLTTATSPFLFWHTTLLC